MVKYICDYCGREIESINKTVCLSLNAFGVSGFEKKEQEDERHFHVQCAYIVRDEISKFLDRKKEAEG